MRQSVLHTYAFNLNYARGLVKGITPAQSATQPGGVPNHPLWVIGHIAAASDFGLGLLKQPPISPAGWDKLFGNKSQPLTDASKYPSLAELLAKLEEGHAKISEAYLKADDATLNATTPVESMRKAFPTVGDLLLFLMTSHETTHLGQLSAWRRAAGLGSVF